MKRVAKRTVTINRAPVLTPAQSKGRHLGIFEPPKLERGKAPKKHGLGEGFWPHWAGRLEQVSAVAGCDKDAAFQVGAVRLQRLDFK